MPFVNIKVAGILTVEQKAQISKEVTESIARIANKPESAILLLIEEHNRENWAKTGKLLSDKSVDK